MEMVDGNIRRPFIIHVTAVVVVGGGGGIASAVPEACKPYRYCLDEWMAKFYLMFNEFPLLKWYSVHFSQITT